MKNEFRVDLMEFITKKGEMEKTERNKYNALSNNASRAANRTVSMTIANPMKGLHYRFLVNCREQPKDQVIVSINSMRIARSGKWLRNNQNCDLDPILYLFACIKCNVNQLDRFEVYAKILIYFSRVLITNWV